MSKRDWTYEQLAMVPLEILEQAWRSVKRLKVLERGKERERERISKAEKRIEQMNQEIADIKIAQAKVAKVDRKDG